MKVVKRVLSVILALCMCAVWTPMKAEAVKWANSNTEPANYTSAVSSYAELTSRLNALMNKYNGTSWTSTGSPCAGHDSSDTCYSKYYYGRQCSGFAKYIFNDLFCGGSIGSTSPGDYALYNLGNATLIGQRISVGSQDGASVKSLLSQAKPGDFIQAHRRGKSYGHSMIVAGISNSGIKIFDCNSGTSRCTVRVYEQNWDTFATKNDSFSLYRSTRYPEDSSITAPTVANLSIDKVFYKIGEEFTFTLSSDVNCDYYFSIVDADSGECIIQGEKVNGTYKNAFQRAGHYVAWMSAANSLGSKDSGFVDFWVFGPPPTTAIFSANKTEIALGETVTLQTSTDAYYVKLAIAVFLYNDTNNGTQVCGGEVPYNFNYTPTENGIYTGYVTAWTHEGGVDSNWVTIHVGKYSVKYDPNGGSGAPSTQTKYYGRDITLSSTKPTRTNYNFLGWATSSSASSAQYQSGGTFACNENTTLYAVWKHICADGHSYSYKVTKTPTTSATGTLTGTCFECSGTTTVTLPMLNTKDYTYKVIKEPSYTATGTGRYTWKTTTYGTFYFYVTLDKLTTTLMKIEIATNPTKTVYEIGESLDTTGLVLKATYSDGSAKTISSGFTTRGFDSSAAGEKTVTVTYGGKSTSFKVTVEEAEEADAPKIVVENVTATAGETVSVSVYLENNPGVAYAKFKIDYSDELTLVAAEDQSVLSGTFTTSKTVDVKPYVLQWMGADNSTKNGCFVILTFQVAEDAKAGAYNITMTCSEAYNATYEDVTFAITNASITVTSHTPGDVNGDGKVNGKDGVLLAQYLAEWDVTINMDAADVNGDGKVNGKDGVLLAQYLAEWDVVLG